MPSLRNFTPPRIVYSFNLLALVRGCGGSPCAPWSQLLWTYLRDNNYLFYMETTVRPTPPNSHFVIMFSRWFRWIHTIFHFVSLKFKQNFVYCLILSFWSGFWGWLNCIVRLAVIRAKILQIILTPGPYVFDTTSFRPDIIAPRNESAWYTVTPQSQSWVFHASSVSASAVSDA